MQKFENRASTDTPDIVDNNNGNDRNMTTWKSEPNIASLKLDLEYAKPENKDQRANVAGWKDLRNATGAESGNKSNRANRSKVQPKLIRKHNEWRYPALSEPFLNSDRMFTVKPRTFEDVDAAKQNELLLNWQFDTVIDKVHFIDKYVRNDVDEGTVIVRVGWDKFTEEVEVEEPVYSYYPVNITDPSSEQHIQQLTQGTELYLNKDPSYEELPEELQAAIEYSAEKQIPVFAELTGTTKVKEQKVTKNSPDLTFIKSDNFFIDPSCDGEWVDAQYMINTYESTRSKLTKKNIYKNLDKVDWESNQIKHGMHDEEHINSTNEQDNRSNKKKSKVVVYEYWGLHDIHNNDILVPILVTWIGDVIIQMIENPFPDKKPPFVIVNYMPISGSVFGEADASLLQDNQRVLGALTRGTIDLMGRSANAQMGYPKNFLDPTNKKRFDSGLDFEYNPIQGDPKQQLQQLTFPEIPNSALTMSAQQNAEAESLSGVKAFSGGITGESFGKVARGITGAISAAEQREMSILRRLAEGLRQIATKIIAMNGQFLTEDEVVRITNSEYIKIKKEDLQGNFDLIVDISTASIDETKANDLGFMLQTIGPDMDPSLLNMVLAEIADLKRMPELAEKFKNYKPPEPDPVQQELAQMELELKKAEIEHEKAKAAKLLAEAEQINVEIKLEADGINQRRGIEQLQGQSKGNAKLEIIKKILEGDAHTDNIEAAVGYADLMETKDEAKTAAKEQSVLEQAQLEALQQQQQEEAALNQQQQLPPDDLTDPNQLPEEGLVQQ